MKVTVTVTVMVMVSHVTVTVTENSFEEHHTDHEEGNTLINISDNYTDDDAAEGDVNYSYKDL